MKWRTKWVFAIILTVGVIGVAKMEGSGVIDKPVTQYVTTGEDFLAMKKWVSSMMDDPDNDTILVSHQGGLLPAYETMQPYKEGVLVSYSNPITITAQDNGLVVFTAITRNTGKTLTVLYDNGDEVTYGFLGMLSKLPYTSVKTGDTLGLMGEEAIYIVVKQDGINLDASLLPEYLSGSVE